MADLNSLIIFAQVVETNSFSGAARILKMPTSTVSRRIKELEDQLGMRLIERSTRSLRLTDAGSEVLEHARRMVELNNAVDNAASNLLSHVSGTLRVASPPSISDTLLAPLAGAFQEAYPDVRVQIFITDRIVDHVSESVDLTFRVGDLQDSSLVARRILKYRHMLVASPEYMKKHRAPKNPRDLLHHRLLAFSFWKPKCHWAFIHKNGKEKETLTFQPYFSMNDYAGLADSAQPPERDNLGASFCPAKHPVWLERQTCGAVKAFDIGCTRCAPGERVHRGFCFREPGSEPVLELQRRMSWRASLTTVRRSFRLHR